MSTRTLSCIEELLDLDGPSATRACGLVLLCRLCADLVHADGAGHVRFDTEHAVSHVCLWRRAAPNRAVVSDQGEAAVTRDRSDWWTPSRARRRVYDDLGTEHLAELPLRTVADDPSLLVVGRAAPFDQDEADALEGARPALLLVERLVEQLLPGDQHDPGTGRGPDSGPVGADLLTAREHEVLRLLREGLLARSIAARLEVSERTVHKHLGNVYRKLDAHDRLLAVRRAEALGLLAARADDLVSTSPQ